MPHMSTKHAAEWTRVRWLIAALLLPLGCAPSEKDAMVSIEADAAAKLQRLPGRIGITLHSYENRQIKSKSYEISNGRTQQVKALPAAPNHSNAMGIGA